METRTDSADNFSTGFKSKSVKAKKASKKKASTMSKWVPILRVAAYDFDEASGEFLDSSQIVELQQETHSKRIKAVVIPD